CSGPSTTRTPSARRIARTREIPKTPGGSGLYFNTHRSSSYTGSTEKAGPAAPGDAPRAARQARREAFRLAAQGDARADVRSEQEDPLEDVEQPEGDHQQHLHLGGQDQAAQPFA